MLLLAFACSGSGDGPTGASEEAVAGACGAVSFTAWSNASGSYVNLGGTKNLLIPSSIQVLTDGSMAGHTLRATLTFHDGTALNWCNYQRIAVYGQASTPLPVVGCTAGYTAGRPINADQLELSATLQPYVPSEAFLAKAVVSYNLDDGLLCTQDVCTNGVISHPPVTAGTVVDDGDPCNGTETCNGTGGVTSSGQLTPFTVGCNNYTCDAAHGGYYVSSSTCSPVSAPGYPNGETLPSDISQGMTFLYNTQTGIDTSKMDAKRLSIIRGRVIDRTGAALSGVSVKILNHGEFGYTITRTDGTYDIVVNGGGTLVVQFSASNYLTAQRQAQTRWLDWTVLPDVALVQPETTTPVLLGDTVWHHARGAQHGGGGAGEDNDLVRTATILVPSGTTIASCSGTTNCNGSTWTGPSTVSMHATEFTVGDNGPKAMPADLPPQSGYTYAVEAGITEAGETTVSFNQPVLFYLENFTNIPFNNGVPAGSYDRSRGVWAPEASGKIYCIISAPSGGIAHLGHDCGTELTTTEYSSEGITDGERTELALASVYGGVTNKQVWRVPMPHFSGWDLNWGAGAPGDAVQPPDVPPRVDTPNRTTCGKGSIIECENQVLRESIPIAGTPYSLNYRSETQRGYHPTFSIPVSVADANHQLPSSLKRIEAEIQVAGQDVVLKPNMLVTDKPQTLSWSWDRTDAYGRLVQGAVHASVEVRYVYQSVPFLAGGFGSYGTTQLQGNRSTREVWFSRRYDFEVGAFDDQKLGLGGWTISAQHVYQPMTATLFGGDGEKRAPSQSPNVIQSYFADPSPNGYLDDIAETADGWVYALHEGIGASLNYLGRVEQSGNQMVLVKKTSDTETSWSDGALLSNVHIGTANQRHLFAEPSGSLLVSDTCRILRVTPDLAGALHVYLVAGDRSNTCASSFAPDNSAAAGTQLVSTYDMAELPDGSVIFLESWQSQGSRLRRIKPNGLLETLVGDGATDLDPACTPPCTPSPVAPHAIKLGSTSDSYSIAAGPDGTIYLADAVQPRVWQLYPRDGMLHVFAGNGAYGTTGDGLLPSTSTKPVSTDSTVRIALGTGSSISTAGPFVLIPNLLEYGVRRVDSNGLITTFAGVHGASSPFAPNVFATRSPLIPQRVVLGPDGYYYTTAAPDSGSGANRIARFRRADDVASGSNIFVPSRNGSEVYKFDSNGRHLATLSGYRGATLLTLGYDGNGRLISITDPHDPTHRTQISGYGTATVTITAPHGQTTQLALDGNGYLSSITTTNSPSNEVVSLTHAATGLLQTLKDPNDAADPGNHTHTFTYSATGLLINDVAPPASAGTRLTRSENLSNGTWSFDVDFSTPESRTTSHLVDLTPSASDTFTDLLGRTFSLTELRTHTDPVSLATKDHYYSDGTKKVELPGGVTTTSSYSPDPRFGGNLLYESMRKVVSGSKSVTSTTSRSASLSNSFDWTTLTQQTDTTHVDPAGLNLTSTRVFDATVSPPTVTTTTAANRVTKVSLDTADDRPTKIELLGNVPCDNGGGGCSSTALNPVQINYDSVGRAWQIVQSSRTWQTNYNPTTGFVDSLQTPLGTTSYARDLVGRPTQITLPGTRVVYPSYDLDGNVTQVWTPEENQHLFSASPRDLLGTYTPPSVSGTGPTTYGYDLDGLLSYADNPTNVIVTYTRDGAGRPITISYPNPAGGTVTNQYTWNPTTGRLDTLASTTTGPNPDATLSYTYDGSMVTRERYVLASPAVTHDVNTSYDSLMRPLTRDLDGAAQYTFGYDNDGILSSVAVGGSTYQITRATTNGMLASSTLGGLSESYSYDAYGGLVQHKVLYNGAPRYVLTIEREAGTGRVHSRSESFNNGTACKRTYTYDSNNFLSSTALTIGCSGTQSYSFTPGGNTTGWTYDAQDRLTSDGVWSMTYTPNGEYYSQTSGSTVVTYKYDALGNLRQFTWPLGYNLTYNYRIDGRNRRVFRSAVNGDGSHGWLYEGDRVIGELDGNGVRLSHFAYATSSNVPDVTLRYNGSAWDLYRIVSDDIGTVRAVICANPSANCVDGTSNYTPGSLAEYNYSYNNDFGAPLSAPHLQPFGFAGGLVDYYPGILRFGARDYSGWSRRWLSKDPIRFGGGINFYAYCDDDPINCTDSDGHGPALTLQCLANVKETPLVPITWQIEFCLSLLATPDPTGTWRDAGNDYLDKLCKFKGDAVLNLLLILWGPLKYEKAIRQANTAENECLKRLGRPLKHPHEDCDPETTDLNKSLLYTGVPLPVPAAVP